MQLWMYKSGVVYEQTLSICLAFHRLKETMPCEAIVLITSEEISTPQTSIRSCIFCSWPIALDELWDLAGIFHLLISRSKSPYVKGLYSRSAATAVSGKRVWMEVTSDGPLSLNIIHGEVTQVVRHSGVLLTRRSTHFRQEIKISLWSYSYGHLWWDESRGTTPLKCPDIRVLDDWTGF